MAEVSEKEQRFLAWLREHGAKFDKLEWPVYRWPGKPHDGERGVRVISDIAPCEEMFSIPEKILMSRKSCMASSIAHVFRKHKDVLFSSRDELALTLLILYEKLDQGNASFWKPMIDILPADPGAASKWSEEELQELQDESLKAEAMIVVASMQQTYQRVLRPILVQHGDVFSVDRYTWEEFRWALLCVESRTFGRFLPHPSIVPFADLLNHVNVQTSYRWLPEERRAAYMCDASGEHVHRRGEEAFMSYGPRSNAELLLHYGFALQSNRYEAVELNFRINTLHHSKNIPCTKIFKTCLRPQVPCFDLLVLFRKFVLDKSLGPSGKGGGSFTHEELRQKCFWDAKMEEEALSLLRKALIDCVRNNFPTTLAGDWREYKSAESMRKKFCLIYRMTRKRVLLQHARFMAIALHELQLQRCKVGSQQQQQSTAVYVEGDDERGGERLWVDSDYLNGATMRWRETLLADSNVGDLEQYDLNMSEPVKAGEEEERTRSYNEICQRSLEFIHQQESSVLSSSSLSFHQSAAVGDNLATRTVTCGEDFTALVCEDGLLFTCGDNTCGKLGHARTEFDCRPSVTAQQFVLRAKVREETRE
ncbi:hypothetical protein GUITHDRAFT_109433 [Guillardia theta CCMP2712]|uniref:Uncharacterized protein n=2 Tax=Guillardia theta TaxID=55529 RepID=L1J7Z9_GUITC|nr:hypothetical protein GUITHDRAFT_109433 [Guillardia theta CCMP2712]EKX44656.1 hypothetical protein GUITHDRAFT_109433 [Guillardia theta CCMP2712]|eukprot:XP_005831636.1 hypothetical protein GUITHDRAFT_109433 [Guillardia theta CCMP2712]